MDGSNRIDPKLEVLTRENCQLIVIDQQPQMVFGVPLINHPALQDNTSTCDGGTGLQDRDHHPDDGFRKLVRLHLSGAA